MERRTVRTSYKAVHLSLRMSRQMLPSESMLGWKQVVMKVTPGSCVRVLRGEVEEEFELESIVHGILGPLIVSDPSVRSQSTTINSSQLHR